MTEPEGDSVPTSETTGLVLIQALTGIPEVGAGDDLSALIHDALTRAGQRLRAGDILVVTSKVVSKARGLTSPHSDRRQAVATETVRVVTERMTSTGPSRIVQGRSGVVMAAAGVDASNTGPGRQILLLPADPDAEAARLHGELAGHAGHAAFGLILSDTAGRPWRGGQIDFALGAHRLRVLQDYRGLPDDDGRILDVTAIAVADELAAAADLVKGKVGRTPVALVRGRGDLVAAPEGMATVSAVPGDTAIGADGTADGVGGTADSVSGMAAGPGGTADVAATVSLAREDTPAMHPGEGAPRRRGAARLVRTGPGDFFRTGSVEAVRASLGVPPGSALSETVGIRPTGADGIPARVRRIIALAACGLPDGLLAWTEPAAGSGGDWLVRIAGEAGEFDWGRVAARLEVAAHAEDLHGSARRTPEGLLLRLTAGEGAPAE